MKTGEVVWVWDNPKIRCKRIYIGRILRDNGKVTFLAVSPFYETEFINGGNDFLVGAWSHCEKITKEE